MIGLLLFASAVLGQGDGFEQFRWASRSDIEKRFVGTYIRRLPKSRSVTFSMSFQK